MYVTTITTNPVNGHTVWEVSENGVVIRTFNALPAYEAFRAQNADKFPPEPASNPLADKVAELEALVAEIKALIP